MDKEVGRKSDMCLRRRAGVNGPGRHRLAPCPGRPVGLRATDARRVAVSARVRAARGRRVSGRARPLTENLNATLQSQKERNQGAGHLRERSRVMCTLRNRNGGATEHVVLVAGPGMKQLAVLRSGADGNIARRAPPVKNRRRVPESVAATARVKRSEGSRPRPRKPAPTASGFRWTSLMGRRLGDLLLNALDSALKLTGGTRLRSPPSYSRAFAEWQHRSFATAKQRTGRTVNSSRNSRTGSGAMIARMNIWLGWKHANGAARNPSSSYATA